MKPKFYKRPRLVHVLWHDADDYMADAPWVPHCDVLEYASADTRMETVALCIGESKRYYIFAGTIQTGSTFRNAISRIPKGCIDRMTRLKPR